MARIGFHCPYEQYAPGELLRYVKHAKAARFGGGRTPEEFRAAARGVTKAEVCEALRVCSELSRHAAWLRADLELGFEALYPTSEPPGPETLFLFKDERP